MTSMTSLTACKERERDPVAVALFSLEKESGELSALLCLNFF